jgi:hypothetical protein
MRSRPRISGGLAREIPVKLVDVLLDLADERIEIRLVDAQTGEVAQQDVEGDGALAGMGIARKIRVDGLFHHPDRADPRRDPEAKDEFDVSGQRLSDLSSI